MINLIDLLEILPPPEPRWTYIEPVQPKKEETTSIMDYIILYLTRIAFFVAMFSGIWWMLGEQFSIARFIVGGLVVGAVYATAEATA